MQEQLRAYALDHLNDRISYTTMHEAAGAAIVRSEQDVALGSLEHNRRQAEQIRENNAWLKDFAELLPTYETGTYIAAKSPAQAHAVIRSSLWALHPYWVVGETPDRLAGVFTKRTNLLLLPFAGLELPEYKLRVQSVSTKAWLAAKVQTSSIRYGDDATITRTTPRAITLGSLDKHQDNMRNFNLDDKMLLQYAVIGHVRDLAHRFSVKQTYAKQLGGAETPDLRKSTS